ncbi:hypothetical protein J6590_106426, partial [Homalodisca vitripennis]
NHSTATILKALNWASNLSFSAETPQVTAVVGFLQQTRVVYCVVICWWSTFTLQKCNQPPELPTAVAYPQGQVPIQKAKLTDITKLTNYTTGYEDFYNALLQWPTTDAEMIERSNEDDE